MLYTLADQLVRLYSHHSAIAPLETYHQQFH